MRERFFTLIRNPIEKIIFLAFFSTILFIMATPYYYLAVVPALLVVFFIILNNNPAFAYYLIIFLIPFGAYRNVSDLKFLKIHWLLAGVLILYIMFKAFLLKHMPAQLKSGLWRLMLLLFSVSVISALFSPFKETAFQNVGLFIVAVMFIVITMFFTDRDALFKYLPPIVVYSVSLSALTGVLGYIFNITFFAENVETGQFKRSIGGSTDPNNYALMIAFSLPLLSEMFDRARGAPVKLLYLGLFVINILAVVFSFSRGGALIISLIMIIIFIRHMKKLNLQRMFLQIFIILAVVAITIGALPPRYFEHFKKVTDTKTDKSIGRRASYIVVGMETFWSHPVIGTGLGTFRDIFETTVYARKFAKEGLTNRRFAHNTYLEYLVGVGIFGLILFMAIIRLIMRNLISARKNFLKNGETANASYIDAYIFSFIVLLCYLFIFSEPFHKYFLLTAGLSQAAHRLSLQSNI
ncbi:MAG: O-antigen ligase family protein [Nitrospirae bacterium YQR-1]